MIGLIEPHEGTQALHNHALRVTGILARFRDINFNGYRHCVNPNTPIEAIRNPARQHQSRDVKVGNHPNSTDVKVSGPHSPDGIHQNPKFFGSFGKEIEGHTIQQGSVRVNNGMQQDIGELATHTSPLS
ncbi:hypothetical protein R3P38DRAFT_2762200 [Favolaschia claudopus]|uniref:Uncharacterized protein n=1 Tax=Favolaschia claudopus TaxID=2862362 RepID=A0AAW0DI50_9AGAR